MHPISPPWSRSVKIIIAVTALVLLLLLIWQFNDLLRQIVVAALLAYLLNPLVVWLMDRTGIRRGPAVLLLYLAFVVAVGALLTVAGMLAIEQAQQLAAVLPGQIDATANLVADQLQHLPETGLQLGPYVLPVTAEQIAAIRQNLAGSALDAAQPVLRVGGNQLAAVAGTAANLFGNGFFILLISIYLTIDSPRILPAVTAIAQQPGYHYDVQRLLLEFVRIWNTYLRGQILVAIISGVLMTVLYLLLGVRFALGLGFIAALLEFVPILGQAILMIITLVITLLQPDNWLGLNPFLYTGLVLVALVVVQQVHSNVITPRIVGHALELHPIAMLVGVIIGTSIWGILGAILAAPLLATVKLFGTYVWRKMFDLTPFDGLPDESPPARPSLADRLTQNFEAQLDEARGEDARAGE